MAFSVSNPVPSSAAGLIKQKVVQVSSHLFQKRLTAWESVVLQFQRTHVGGRLGSFPAQWQDFGASRKLRLWFAKRYPLPFATTQKRSGFLAAKELPRLSGPVLSQKYSQKRCTLTDGRGFVVKAKFETVPFQVPVFFLESFWLTSSQGSSH